MGDLSSGIRVEADRQKQKTKLRFADLWVETQPLQTGTPRRAQSINPSVFDNAEFSHGPTWRRHKETRTMALI